MSARARFVAGTAQGNSNAAEMLRWEHCRRELDRRLARTGRHLFAELTGLPLQIAWRPCGGSGSDGLSRLPPAPACRAARRRVHREKTCLQCVSTSMDGAVQAGKHGHAFVCPFGLANYWQSITVGPCCLGVAFFQMPARRLRAEGGWPKSRGWPRGGKPVRALDPLHCPRFVRGCHLLQFIVHDAVETARADSREHELRALSQCVTVHEHFEADLRAALRRPLPLTVVRPGSLASETHRQQIVHRMLDYLHTGCPGPVSLRACAASVNMNPAYLSALFSEMVGLPFRSYLRRLRLEQAETLLRDPLRRVSEIAAAVGYADANQLRLSFKALTGLAPSAWRQACACGE